MSAKPDRSLLVRLALVVVPVLAGFYLIYAMQADRQVVGNQNPVARKYGPEVLLKVYPDLDIEQIDRLLTETWERTLAYETFTQFRENTFAGEFVTVDRHGFRHSENQGPWPPAARNYNVFVFGGSVTFGYGGRDSQTIPSYLQALLDSTTDRRVRVYNFGRGHYYSRQEMVLFENLLLEGFVPDMALFMDGSNDFFYANNKALFSDQFERISTQVLRPDEQDTDGPEPTVYEVADRYLATKRMIEAIAGLYGIQTVFVWLPTPQYKYDLDYHLFAAEGFDDQPWAPSAYRYMAALTADRPPGRNFIWCADIQEGLQEPLYVDRYHYTARLAEMIARCAGDAMIDRRLLPVGDTAEK